MTRLRNIMMLFYSFTCFQIVHAQKVTYYNFVDYQSRGATKKGGFNFTYRRESQGDSLYKEAGLFSRDSTKVYTFKKKDGIWQIKTSRGWMPFFDRHSQFKTKIVVEDYPYKIRWRKTNFTDDDLSIYKLTLVPDGFSVSGIPSFYFTYKDGIIAIDGHETLLIRSDKKGIRL